MTLARVLLLTLSGTITSCGAVLGGWRAFDTASSESVDLQAMARQLAEADVVFLGEEHDNNRGHELQLRLLELLVELRPDTVLSLEQFERDAQDQVNLYLRGAIDEARFLANSRPWPSYKRHYRPLLELAKDRGLPVIAANCYRPLASQVARQGLTGVLGDPWCAVHLHAGPGSYRDKFMGLMGQHAADAGARMERFFQAQCLKDDTMAESIAGFLERRGAPTPLVVHLCGRFHSDDGLGTVERLRRRRPDLRLAIVTMISTRNPMRGIRREERALADFVWLVPRM